MFATRFCLFLESLKNNKLETWSWRKKKKVEKIIAQYDHNLDFAGLLSEDRYLVNNT